MQGQGNVKRESQNGSRREGSWQNRQKADFEDKIKEECVERQGKDGRNESENEFQCRRCNKKHEPRECPTFRKKCNRCGKLNHFEAACRLKRIQEIEDLQDEENLTIELINIVKGKIHQIGVVA